MKGLIDFLNEAVGGELVSPGTVLEDNVNHFRWVVILNAEKDETTYDDGSLRGAFGTKPIKYKAHEVFIVREEIYEKIKNNRDVKNLMRTNEMPDYEEGFDISSLIKLVQDEGSPYKKFNDDHTIYIRFLNSLLKRNGNKTTHEYMNILDCSLKVKKYKKLEFTVID